MDNRKFKNTIRKHSRKDYSHFRTFGASSIPAPARLSFLTEILTQNGEKCTAWTAVAIRESMKGKKYDPEAYWQAELAMLGKKDANGVDLETQMATGVKTGFIPLDSSSVHQEPQDNATAYFSVTKAPGMDLFDSIKQCMADMGVPLSVGLGWYREWDNTPQGIVPHTFSDFLGYHDTKIAGFETLNGVEYLTVQGSWGTSFGDQGVFRFDRYMVNKCFGLGVFYWTDSEIPEVKRVGLFVALLKNLANLYQRIFVLKQNGFPPPDLVTDELVNAIIQVESSGNDYAIGDMNLKSHAYGPMQIRLPVCLDVNSWFGTKYAPTDMQGNRPLSIWVFRKYMQIYATQKRLGRPVTDEDRARIWNGGPFGWEKTHNPKLEAKLANYWQQVQSHL